MNSCETLSIRQPNSEALVVPHSDKDLETSNKICYKGIVQFKTPTKQLSFHLSQRIKAQLRMIILTSNNHLHT